MIPIKNSGWSHSWIEENRIQEVFKEELQEENTFTRESTIDSDAEMLIPDNYVSNINETVGALHGAW